MQKHMQTQKRNLKQRQEHRLIDETQKDHYEKQQTQKQKKQTRKGARSTRKRSRSETSRIANGSRAARS